MFLTVNLTCTRQFWIWNVIFRACVKIKKNDVNIHSLHARNMHNMDHNDYMKKCKFNRIISYNIYNILSQLLNN